MSNKVKLKARPSPVTCEECGLKFTTDFDRQMHWKNLRDGRACLSVRSMTQVIGFYRTRGAWRLGRR